jgi:hypothetical protein
MRSANSPNGAWYNSPSGVWYYSPNGAEYNTADVASAISPNGASGISPDGGQAASAPTGRSGIAQGIALGRGAALILFKPQRGALGGADHSCSISRAMPRIPLVRSSLKASAPRLGSGASLAIPHPGRCPGLVPAGPLGLNLYRPTRERGALVGSTIIRLPSTRKTTCVFFPPIPS